MSHYEFVLFHPESPRCAAGRPIEGSPRSLHLPAPAHLPAPHTPHPTPHTPHPTPHTPPLDSAQLGAAERESLQAARNELVKHIMQLKFGVTKNTPNQTPTRLVTKFVLPEDTVQGGALNLVGLIIGPRGKTQQKLQVDPLPPVDPPPTHPLLTALLFLPQPALSAPPIPPTSHPPPTA